MQTCPHIKTNEKKSPGKSLLFSATLLLAVNSALAQTVPPSSAASSEPPPKQPAPVSKAPAATPPPEEEIVVLSPFEVTGQQSNGYLEDSTLAGNRLNTRLRDVGSAISVYNAQMLQDIAATNNETLLQYTTNAEVGNIYGNMANVGSGQVLEEKNNHLTPQSNTRIRGLASADNTMDFFLTDIPWDSYNISRIDMQRGPNAILFGLGSPAGIINAGTNTAELKKTKGKVEVRFASFGTVRGTLDYNQVLIPQELAVRVDLLNSHEKFQQEPAFQKDRRVFGALRYEPGFLKKGNAQTILRANFEKGEIRSRRPRVLPPGDSISQWFYTGQSPGFTSTGAPRMYNNLNKQGFDQRGLHNNQFATFGDPSRGAFPSGLPNGQPSPVYQPWLGGQFAANYFGSPLAIYESDSGTPRYFQMAPNTPRGLNTSGGIDGNIGGIPGNSTASSITTYRDWTRKTNQPGAFLGYQKNLLIHDPSIFDFYNNLIDGPNKKEWHNFERYNVNLAQTFFDQNVGIELAHDQQRYDNGQIQAFQDKGATLFVDVIQTFVDGSTNPNFGRPFIGEPLNNNRTNKIKRDSDRVTAFVKYPFEERHPDSLIARILGTHTLTGFYNRDRRTQDARSFARFGVDRGYRDLNLLGANPLSNSNFDENVRMIFPAIYLGPSIYDRTSAAGANIPRSMHEITAPSGTVRVFDSTWAPPAGVTPNQFWENTLYPVGNSARNSTQSENPANYRGWVNAPINVLDSEKGHRDALTTGATLTQVKIESAAAVYNASFFNGSVVAMYGFREDYVKTNRFNGFRLPNENPIIPPAAFAAQGGPANLTPFDVPIPTEPWWPQQYSRGYLLPEKPLKTEHMQAHTWSVVAHLTELFPRNPLPLEASVFYNKSENSAPVAGRVGLFGEDLGPPEGDTTEVGFMLATKDRKYSLRFNTYKTVLTNSSSTAGFGGTFMIRTLFTNFHRMRNVYAFRIDGNRFDLSGSRGNDPLPNRWTWEPRADQTPTQAAEEQARAIAAWDAFIAQVPAEFLRAFNLDYGRVYDYGLDSRDPVGLTLTEDSVSEGYEMEFIASPVRGLRMSFNASKQEAKRSNQGNATWNQMVNFINAGMATDAGLMRSGSGANSSTARLDWNSNFNAPWQTVKLQEGGAVSEMRKWRANVVVNYDFQQSFLKGFNVGGGYRWQDKAVIGWEPMYLDVNGNPHPNPSASTGVIGKMNFNKPYYAPAESDVDLWIGYKRALTRKISFRTQLNVRNVGRGDYLIPITTQPDGTPAGVRIGPPQVWTLTNTFEF